MFDSVWGWSLFEREDCGAIAERGRKKRVKELVKFEVVKRNKK